MKVHGFRPWLFFVFLLAVALGISTTLSPTPGILDAQAQSTDQISMADILDAILDGSGSSGSTDLDPVTQAVQIYFIADFESTNDGFTLDGLWHRSTNCSTTTPGVGHTTTGALRCGDVAVAPGACDYLIAANGIYTADSPALDLSSVSVPAVLTFNYFLDTDGSGADIARVRVSTDAGTTFATIADNAGSPISLTDDGTWHSETVSLSAFIGNTIVIRFEFQTDATNGPGEGFYVDDIVVTADDGVIAGTPGDVNCNGSVTPGDAQAAFDAFLGLSTPECLGDGDVCPVGGDGFVTPGDAQGIFNMFLGLPTPCE